MQSDSYSILVGIISLCSLLTLFSLAKHYAKKSIVPPDAWILIAGITYGITLKEFSFESLPTFTLNADIIILVFLPLLIFASGRLIKPRHLKSEFLPVGLFSTFGVIATSFIIGAPIAWILDIPLLHGLLLGVAASATDPAAAASIFHNFTIPARLEAIVEGESLFNDGSTVVLFGLIISLVFSNSEFDITQSLGIFIWTIIAALPLGFILGRASAFIIHKWGENDTFYDLSITVIMSYASFLVADKLLHISGVIAVLVATITFYKYRNYQQASSSETPKLLNNTDAFWDYIAPVANGILFFSLGTTTGLHDFSEVPGVAMVVAVVSLILARCIVIYSMSAIINLIGHKLPLQWQNILVLGGLRGAVSAALVLMIPSDYAYRGIFLCLIVAMIIFTLIIQPMLLKFYLDKIDARLTVNKNKNKNKNKKIV